MAQNGLICLWTKAAFTRANSKSCVGYLDVDLKIHNASGIDANMPFIAFSALGLTLIPRPGWKSESIASAAGRRLVRFASPAVAVLPAEGTAEPCALRLAILAAEGGMVEVVPALRKPVAAMSDITLSYVLGAGNFPPLRASLVIPASAIVEPVFASGVLPHRAAAS